MITCILNWNILLKKINNTFSRVTIFKNGIFMYITLTAHELILIIIWGLMKTLYKTQVHILKKKYIVYL